MERPADAKNRRGRWARETARRKEIVNAARMYERAAEIGHELSRGRLDAVKRGEDSAGLRARWQAAVSDSNAAWQVLARLITVDTHALVDGILYARSRQGDFQRFAVGQIEDWGAKR